MLHSISEAEDALVCIWYIYPDYIYWKKHIAFQQEWYSQFDKGCIGELDQSDSKQMQNAE